MDIRTLAVFAALAISCAVRVDQDVVARHINRGSRTTRNLCSEWLLVSYNDGADTEESIFGSYRFLEHEWKSVELFKKTTEGGCVKKYIAECEEGHLRVEEACMGNATTSSENRCLGGFGCMGPTGGRKSTVGETEVATVFRKGAEAVNIQSGKLLVWTADPSEGIDLEDEKKEWGCYCCKHSYSALNNPFSMSNKRLAWDRGADGNMECMMAWTMVGNFMNTDDPSNTSFLGVLALIPEAIVTAMDMATLTIGRHLACASTCPLRKAQYEENQYSFTKVQTDVEDHW